MKIMFIIMFMSIIIAPFLYFYYLFRHQSKIFKNILTILSLISLIVMIIKIFFHPYSPLFFTITYICQFYMIFLIISCIIVLLYQLITHLIHQQLSSKILISLFVISLLLTGTGFFTHHHKTIKHYDITMNKYSSLSGLKIAAFSDIHLSTGTNISDLETLTNKLNENEYDIVCFVGDLFDETTPIDMVEDALRVLSNIKTKYGIYAVDGNHEHYANILDSSIYEKYDIQYLSNKYVCIDGLFNILGREDLTSHSQESLNEISQGMNKDLPTIVLDHNPKRYQDVMEISDLQISGHTHAGQIFPFSLITSLLYDNQYGLLQNNDFSLVVTSGYGSWGFPFRLLTNCEFIELQVTFTKK